jgi:hypothetical protein
MEKGDTAVSCGFFFQILAAENLDKNVVRQGNN